VLDSALRLSPQRQLFRLASPARTLLVHVEGKGGERAAALTAAGAELLAVPGRPGEVDLEAMLRALLRRDVLHVLVEGGPRVFSAFLRAGLADSLVLHLAPRLVGGDGLSWLGPLGVERMAAARPVRVESVRALGKDLEIRALVGPA
jgi:diaminohydroxyphosphoribosylaminopyrimidine deaminase/5-amino-6-(5-phosphoribosylamino)uracil reductase